MKETFETDKSLLFFYGPINIELVAFLGNYLKNHIKDEILIVNKVHRIFVELVQNVSYYSADQFDKNRTFGTGIGEFKVNLVNSSYHISTKNFIKKTDGEVLKKNCREINSLNENDLRELKRKTRGMASVKDIGAHIGLIKTGLISQNPLNISIDPHDDAISIFRLTAIIDRE